jgi:glutamate-5-semialdehyde dehydrogenase
MAECELNVAHIVTQTKKNWPKLAILPHEERCEVIKDIAQALLEQPKKVIEANQKDLSVATNDGLSSALLDRLTLTESRLNSMIAGLQKIANLPDPLADIIEWQHRTGMSIQKVPTPIGVILVVYEARPNVTTDTVGLALKTCNAAILKGSRQTKYTNTALAEIISNVLHKYGLSEAIAFFPQISHQQGVELVGHPALDLIIPRGGEGLKAFVKQHAKAPVLGAGGGICHIYVSETADLEAAKNIILNSKTQRPGVCNALETVLLHKSLLKKEIIDQLFGPLLEHQVIIKAEQKVALLNKSFEQANEEDWATEYLDLILSVKSVASLDEAIEHINSYGTGHSDAIITADQNEANLFCKLVDSGCVYVNASTRFTDGEEFGFGAEIGISTQKLHARGPIGSKELTTYKYLIKGNGQTR